MSRASVGGIFSYIPAFWIPPSAQWLLASTRSSFSCRSGFTPLILRNVDVRPVILAIVNLVARYLSTSGGVRTLFGAVWTLVSLMRCCLGREEGCTPLREEALLRSSAPSVYLARCQNGGIAHILRVYPSFLGSSIQASSPMVNRLQGVKWRIHPSSNACHSL